jgi:hypothetical protein
LWLYWQDRNDWRATRSNKAATRFGRVTVVKLPSPNDLENSMIAGNGGAGPLEAIATITTPTNVNQIISRQILPRLSITAPHAIKRGKTLHVKVTDVGDAVKGATVRFAGHNAKTNSKGVAKFAISKHAKTGRTKITSAIKGYKSITAKVKIKR